MVKTNLLLTDMFDRQSLQPVFFNPRTKDFRAQIGKIKSSNPQLVVIDKLLDQLEELFLLRHPKYRFNKNYQTDFQQFLKKFLDKQELWQAGQWIYFPWLNYLVHFLDEPLHQELRTGRNVYLITRSEQKKFYNARIGILGLSVGSHVALTITLTGGGKYLKLADPDEISGSNLNRIRSPFYTVGLNKAIAVARQIYEINPYANLSVFAEGLTGQNLKDFLLKPKLDVLIEEMDNPYLKIRVRELARQYRIPVIMAADNGDNIIVDVERYDLHPSYPLLHGLLGKIQAQDFNNIKPADLPKVVGRIAGANLATARMLQSVLEVGKTVYSWPQLGNAATLCGCVLTQLARKIIIGEKVKEGRIDFNVDKLLSYLPKSAERQRQRLLKKFSH